MIYGYARASVRGPTIQEQESQLKRAGCVHIFCETEARKRDQLALALQAAAFGDLILVTSLSRIAKNIGELLDIYTTAMENGTGIISLSEPITDPATEEGRHFPKFAAWCAMFDLVTRSELLAEGRARAIAEGRSRPGKPSKLSPEQWADVVRAYAAGESCKDIAKRYKVGFSTIYRGLRRKGAIS